MAVKARDEITIIVAVDVQKVETWYKLQSSTAQAPTKPTTASPSGWTKTEPTYDGTSTKTLYTCQCTTLTDGTFFWGEVCVSSSYEAAKRAYNAAVAAQNTANATNQHFWFDTGGAHVSTEANNATGAQNSLWNSNGMLFRNAAKNLVSIAPSSIAFFDGDGNDQSNIVAQFGRSAIVGKEDAAHTLISDTKTVFHDAHGEEAGKISMSSEGAVPASATYTITTSGTNTASKSITGITPLPDFTLGYLVLRNKVSSGGGGIARFESWSEVASPVTMSTSTIDYTFKATQNGDTWNVDITATNRSGTTTSQTVEYTLEWYYFGTAPMYIFGTGENAGAYSFAAGIGVNTAKPAQIVLGSYNEPSQTDLFMLGNGTSDGNRSNALRVDENNVLHIVSFSQYAGGVELTQSALWSWQQALFGYSDSEDWTYLAGSASGNFCRWRVHSGWMQIEIYYTSGAGLTANTAKHYGAIPGNFKPDHEVNNALYLGANKNGQADMWVTNGGAVWVNSTIASSTIYGQLQYPIPRPL